MTTLEFITKNTIFFFAGVYFGIIVMLCLNKINNK